MIHKTAIIGKDVKMGSNVKIGPFCVITGTVVIGDNVVIYSHCSIGAPGESINDEMPVAPQVIIGNNVTIREFVTINASLGSFGSATLIGHNSYLMTKSHIGHDAIVSDNAVI